MHDTRPIICLGRVLLMVMLGVVVKVIGNAIGSPKYQMAYGFVDESYGSRWV